MAYTKHLINTHGIVNFEGIDLEYEMKEGQVFIAGNNIGRVDFFPTYEDDQMRWMGTISKSISFPSSWQAANPSHAVYLMLEFIRENRQVHASEITAKDLLA